MTGPKKVPSDRKVAPEKDKPILRAEIEEAQRHTRSNRAAARYLNVGYNRYKRYAKLYGIFDSHLNEAGRGISKGFGKHANTIPLRDVLAGKHPKYSRSKLRNRLIARGKLAEVCALCQFAERRITDNKIPLMLVHKDGDKNNFALDNLELLCYNCCFLTTGAHQVLYRQTMEKTLRGKELKSMKGIVPDIHIRDYFDPVEDAELYDTKQLLSPEDIADIQNEFLKE